MFKKSKLNNGWGFSFIASLLCSTTVWATQVATEQAASEQVVQQAQSAVMQTEKMQSENQSPQTAGVQQVAAEAVQAVEALQAETNIATSTEAAPTTASAVNAESAVSAEETAAKEAEQAAKLLAQQKLKALLGGTPVQFEAALADLYADTQFTPIWTDKNAEKAFLQQYVVWVLSGVSGFAAEELAAISRTDNAMTRDILLSDAFLNYLYYQENLKKSSTKWLYGNSGYKVALPSQARLDGFKQAIADGQLSALIQKLASGNKRYQQTVQKVLASLPDSIGSAVTVSETLKPGMQSADVKNLATILKGKGLLSAAYNSDVYDNELLVAVKQFQSQNGLTADGIVGAGTRNVLNQNLSNNLYKLSINAQRLSLLPNETNGIFVNIPTYQLHYYRDGKQVLHSKVIVGKKDRQTPVMSSRLSNVVINPPWNAPVRNINQDIIPKVRQDPSYIYRKGYTIIDGKGRTIDPYTIDWENMTAKNFPYRLRQAPGGDSALGSYKFNMPSSDAIYLHDTPSKGLFARNDRALSSGCVRVHKSDELASLLLGENGWSNERKNQVLASKKTTSANLSKRDDVFLYYVTAWVENGKIQTAPDIYGHDRKLAKTNVNWKAVKAMLH
ncbi:Murein L,D-transpeptidase YcbB/YkuD [Pasteurella testudinis DSM 23072]|uniref:Murein L,D-transpeptidase YcbB/YkuD n=1 Tax=Pasteurella testudinis DSM 23072 TaxID=1122938 RepID=A0A1W1UWW1_9PAST|nr:L,D-transpeptidase family protein [Pasteurella testudinis]SMB85489.1 Murein L,D-transpeptidase YcbB/YkuD [Pasteurella testudinis DSM 23072]SUB51467.1 putative L,D-transpeptidase 7 [Pasteurella testudinis]